MKRYPRHYTRTNMTHAAMVGQGGHSFPLYRHWQIYTELDSSLCCSLVTNTANLWRRGMPPKM